jgi:hypothetical protein
MATNYKVLAQSAPAATTSTLVYTVPTSTSAVVSTITVCNRNASTAGTYRIAVTNTTVGNASYVVYDSSLDAKSTVAYTLGMTLDAGYKVYVYASSADFSFNVFGSEIV